MTPRSALLALAFFVSVAPSRAHATAAAADGTPWLDQAALQIEMARLATEHPDLVDVVAVGESREKRRIEALRIGAGERANGRPAVLLVANVDGPLAWTSSLALDHARDLADRYASDARVRAVLDTTTIYVVPRANPDGARSRFETPLQERRGTGTGVDDDRDGREGEDPPSDVDGDGLVTWMRVPDPDGTWAADPSDPRATIPADRARGVRGTWKLVREGRDSDRDESASEDAEHDADVNRNFPQGWQEHGPASGRFATDEPEARALCEFVLAHRDIALVWTYGELDDVVDAPKTEGKRGRQSANPSDGLPEADAGLHAELSRRFARIGRGAKGTGKDAGTFQAWVQAQRGLWAVNVVPWTIPLDTAAAEGHAGEKDGPSPGDEPKTSEPAKKGRGEGSGKSKDDPGPSDDAKRLRWIDAHTDSVRFVPWKPFVHPELGPVEIGGFAPYATLEPPSVEVTEIARKNTEFLLELCEALPRARVVGASAHDLGEGLWRVEAALENPALLSHPSALGRRTGHVRPFRVTLVVPQDARILAGPRQMLVDELPGSGGRRELSWLVRGAPPSEISITVDSDCAGALAVKPEVK